MKIRFLGTGAADWGPDCTDKNGNHRFLSSAVIDDVLLIDPGPHVFESAEKYNIDIGSVKYIINTHSHPDHYSEDTVKRLKAIGAEFIKFAADEEKRIGDYLISAYAANHSTADDAVHFIINSQDKRIFYGLDGAWLLYREVAAIKESGVDLAVLDGTVGNIFGDYRIFEHNNLSMVKEIRESLKGYVKIFAISHMAYTLHDAHEELSREMHNYDIITAFDGMEIEI